MPDESARQTTTTTPIQPSERSDDEKLRSLRQRDDDEQGEEGEERPPDDLGRRGRGQRALGKARARPGDRGDEHRHAAVAGRMRRRRRSSRQSSTVARTRRVEVVRPVVAEAVGRLGTEGAFAVLARARALEASGRDVIHLEIGEPDFETPAHVAEAGIAAIRAGETHYCQTAGLPVLREAAAASLSRSRGLPIDRGATSSSRTGPSRSSSSPSSRRAGRVTRSSTPIPGFPIYESAVRFAGAEPVPLPLREERGFSFDPTSSSSC